MFFLLPTNTSEFNLTCILFYFFSLNFSYILHKYYGNKFTLTHICNHFKCFYFFTRSSDSDKNTRVFYLLCNNVLVFELWIIKCSVLRGNISPIYFWKFYKTTIHSVLSCQLSLIKTNNRNLFLKKIINNKSIYTVSFFCVNASSCIKFQYLFVSF